MVLQVKQETNYGSTLRGVLAKSNEPAWLKMLRENAIGRFSEMGFPGVENEDWKYTNVAPFLHEEFEIAATSETIEDKTFAALPETANSRLVFVNGKFNAELSNLSAVEESASVLTLTEAIRNAAFAEIIKTHLARLVDYNANGFTALNAAMWHDGAFIFVPKNTKVAAPIELLFVGTMQDTASFPRVLVFMEQGAEAVLVENYTRTEETKYLTNAVVEIVLADQARLIHTRVQRESHAALHVGTTKASLGRGSFYDSTNIMLGGALSRHDVGVKFNSEGAECFVDGLYLVSETQHTDTHSVIDHAVPNCVSHQTYKGVLNDKSRAVFNGKVFVREHASGTDAQQSNKNLLLSNDARVDTKPQLEIFNDDVKCAHGATVGQLEEEELFYLRSRGLSEPLSRNLLTYGFAEEIINKIGIESIKAQLDEAVLNRLDA
ncbi:MAG: Fe-S cluster assembly protein SufD, partial [Pyrinomonadaceae bacterium]